MPNRPEWRHLYRGAAWRAIRAKILVRAGGEFDGALDDSRNYVGGARCERCGRPDRVRVKVSVRAGGAWYDAERGGWRDASGPRDGETVSRVRWTRTILSTSHLNHVAGDDRDENLAALCQWCHLHHDRRQHYASARRNRARAVGQAWLSAEIERAAEPGGMA